MNKIIIVMTIITAVLLVFSWIDFMSAYEEFIGLEEELRFYGPMMK